MIDWTTQKRGKLRCWWDDAEVDGQPIYIDFDGKRLPQADEVWILYEKAVPYVAPTDLPVGPVFEIWDEWINTDLRHERPEECFVLSRVDASTIQIEFSIYRSEDDYHGGSVECEREVETFYEVAKDLSNTDLLDPPEYEGEEWAETRRKWDLQHDLDRQGEIDASEKKQTSVAKEEGNERERASESNEVGNRPQSPLELPEYEPYPPHPFYEWEPPESPSWYRCVFGRSFDVGKGQFETLEPIVDHGVRIREEVFTEVDRRLGRLDEPEEVKNEAIFTRRVVTPLLRDLGFRHVEIVHGPNENGKDIVFARLTEFGDLEWWAAQVKFGDISGSAKKGQIQTLLNQVHAAFGTQFISAYTKRRETVSKVAVVISGSFTANAREEIVERLNNPARRSNVVFVDGQRIEELRCVLDRRE